MNLNVVDIKESTRYTGDFGTHRHHIPGTPQGTDASEVIPARLSVGALPTIVVDSAYGITSPAIQIPYVSTVEIPLLILPGELDVEELFDEDDVRGMIAMDATHNPVLAGLWADETNDNLVADS